MRRVVGMILGLVLAGSILAVGGAPPVQASTTECAISAPSSKFHQEVKMSAGHARVWRLYQAFFLRQPDRSGFQYWIKVRSQGASLKTLADSFGRSDEFKARYGNLTHGQYVDLVYRNVLCRKPDSSGRSYWVNLLKSRRITRYEMIINFVELREYLRKTRTCHSIFDSETAAVSSCPLGNLRPLSQATMSTDGYKAKNVAVARVGGGIGSFRGVEVDLSRNVFATGNDRCAVASINANWTVAAEKDQPDPHALGVGVVEGRHVKGSSDRTDRGIVGLRFDSSPKNVVEVWPGDTKSPDDTRLNSVMWHKNKAVVESWRASAETSPYLWNVEPDQIVRPEEWVWAAAGVPLRIDGQTDKDFMAAYYGDPYTHQTRRHPFIAVDQHSGRLIFAATQDLDTRDLVVWAENHGYEDLVKFDGGGSAEFNINRKAVVAGTWRDLPVWLGVGC